MVCPVNPNPSYWLTPTGFAINLKAELLSVSDCVLTIEDVKSWIFISYWAFLWKNVCQDNQNYGSML